MAAASRPILSSDQRYIEEIFDPVSNFSRAARIAVPVIVLLGGLALVVLGATAMLPMSVLVAGAVIGGVATGTLIYFTYKRNREMDTWAFKARALLPQEPKKRTALERQLAEFQEPKLKSQPSLPEWRSEGLMYQQTLPPERPALMVDDVNKERQRLIFDWLSQHPDGDSELEEVWTIPTATFHTLALPETYECTRVITHENQFSIKSEILRRITFDETYIRHFCRGNELKLQVKLNPREIVEAGEPWIVEVELVHEDPSSRTSERRIYICARVPASRWEKSRSRSGAQDEEPLEIGAQDHRNQWHRFGGCTVSYHSSMDKPSVTINPDFVSEY